MMLCYWPWLLPFRGHNWIRVLKPRQTPAHRPLVNTLPLFKLVPRLTGKAASLGSYCFSSIPPTATTVVSLPHFCFWTSPPGILLSGFSPVHPTPVTQHAVSLHTTALVRLCIILSLWC
ncbi:hypothetical protein E2C01_090511 [Portunus trituberculatus]|uniref:Uncharacterized protein n=1 Tax=Portunus trituberculatus TaxID=210409 RepID=A0A5B7JQB2_PORTR|nr:hypothetical protein [Portunus trituberculatus]